MATPTKELAFKCFKDTNDCWSATITMTNGIKNFNISAAAAPSTKNRAAKSFIKELLTEQVADFMERNPTWKVLEEK